MSTRLPHALMDAEAGTSSPPGDDGSAEADVVVTTDSEGGAGNPLIEGEEDREDGQGREESELGGALPHPPRLRALPLSIEHKMRCIAVW